MKLLNNADGKISIECSRAEFSVLVSVVNAADEAFDKLDAAKSYELKEEDVANVADELDKILDILIA